MLGLKLENSMLGDRYEVFGRIAASPTEESFVARDIRAKDQTVLVRASALIRPPSQGTEAVISARVDFAREAEIARAVAHPQIVSLLDQGNSADAAGREFSFLVYEYLAGGNINDHCRRQITGHLPLHESARLFEQVGSALAHLHRHGIYFPALKPGNLRITADNRGIKLAGAGRSAPETFAGFEVEALQTDAYAAPSLPAALAGDDGARRTSDVYALAKICYTALTGQTPAEFTARPIDRLPVALADEPWAGAWLQIMRRATSSSVAERYDSATDFSRDLTALASEHTPREAKVERKLAPEEKELIRKRAQFSPIEEVLAQRELELATLKVELREFEGRYLRLIGTKHAELDELEAQVAEENSRHFPEDVELRIAAVRARSRAQDSAEAAKRHASSAHDCETFEPSERLKNLYRELARLIHPDTVLQTEQKERRHVLMAEVNQAYEANDFGKLQNMLGDWEHSPEAVKGHGPGAELIRVIRRIDQAEDRLALIQSETTDLQRAHVYQLMEQTNGASAEGRDHLHEMGAKLDNHIREARRRLRELGIGAAVSN
jgi:serine/threonine protein kinase